MIFGGLKSMWVIVLFDLPVDSKKARKQYALFRKKLLNDGFGMMQYSVYYRHCASDENARVHSQRIRRALPNEGEIRILKITDKQFGKIEIYCGKKRQPAGKTPVQLELF